MQNDKILNNENKKILGIINKEFITLNFSDLSEIVENSYNETLWMDVYILIYKCNIPPDITAFDILLKKLSKPVLKFLFKYNDKEYIVDGNENSIRQYVRYLITKEKIDYKFPSKYIPHKEYIKEILKFNKFRNIDIEIKHVKDSTFNILPMNYEINDLDNANELYEKLFDAYNLYTDLKFDKHNLLDNIESCINLGRDTRMIATLSIILNSFKCNFRVLNNSIGIEGTKVCITDENSAKIFQEHILFAYQFFRNVVNTEDKKNIAIELYNKQVSPDILEEFNNKMISYLNIVENRDLIEWIITISKESRHTLKISFDDQGVFNIEENKIVTPLEAKEYYISYMEKKKAHTALTIYRSTIISKIKKVWTIIKSKFIRR
jgi:hypothetical protein